VKKAFSMILILLILFLSSCSKAYVTDYSDTYTLEYCSENYTWADPNLKALYIAENYIGEKSTDKYFALKDISLEKYLVFKHQPTFFSDPDNLCIMKNVNCKDFPIIDYTAIKAELFWEDSLGDVALDSDKILPFWGEKVFYESVADLNATEFQRYICDAIASGEYYYRNSGDEETSVNAEYIKKEFFNKFMNSIDVNLSLRVYFNEYSNLVWDAKIASDKDEKYYILVYITNETNPQVTYNEVYIQLPEDISEIISDIELD